MNSEYLGSMFSNRLSFLDIFLRKAVANNYKLTQVSMDVDARFEGSFEYRLDIGERSYTLLGYTCDLPPHMAVDSVSSEQWDITAALYDGVPTDKDRDRLARYVPLQEAAPAGFRETELTLSRYNRSNTVYSHMIDKLSKGKRVDMGLVSKRGYIVRNTAVYANRAFGLASFDSIRYREELSEPYQVEMMTLAIMRTAIFDLVDKVALMTDPECAGRLSEADRKAIGIGNSSATGLYFWAINNSKLLSRFIETREKARDIVRNSDWSEEVEMKFKELLDKKIDMLDRHTFNFKPLVEELKAYRVWLDTSPFLYPRPFEEILDAADKYSYELQESILAVSMDANSKLVDGLSSQLTYDGDDYEPVYGKRSIKDLVGMIKNNCGWALDIDWEKPTASFIQYYRKAVKSEPAAARRRSKISGTLVDMEPARGINNLYDTLMLHDYTSVQDLLSHHPEHYEAVKRVQIYSEYDYAAITSNTTDRYFQSCNVIRAVLSLFGARTFRYKDNWCRVRLLLGAEEINNLTSESVELWRYQ